MGIYDTVILHESVEIEDFPFNPSYKELFDEGERRMWQTKDIFPSMDTYAILPISRMKEGKVVDSEDESDYEEDGLSLYRRHPPVTKWTNQNLGTVGEEYPEDIVDDAEHWRQVRLDGTITISDFPINARSYEVRIEFNRGKVEKINPASEYKVESVSIFPPSYMDVVDLSDYEPTYKGRDVGEIVEAYYNGTELDIPDEHIGSLLSFYDTRTMEGEMPDFDDFFEDEIDGEKVYKGKTVSEWIDIINDDESDLEGEEEEIISLYNDVQKDLEFYEEEMN
jgi:hypothetical protein